MSDILSRASVYIYLSISESKSIIDLENLKIKIDSIIYGMIKNQRIDGNLMHPEIKSILYSSYYIKISLKKRYFIRYFVNKFINIK